MDSVSLTTAQKREELESITKHCAQALLHLSDMDIPLREQYLRLKEEVEREEQEGARQEAEERLSFLEGAQGRIGEEEKRAAILKHYTQMIKSVNALPHSTVHLSLKDKQCAVFSESTRFRQEASSILGEDVMQQLFGSNEEISALLGMRQS